MATLQSHSTEPGRCPKALATRSRTVTSIIYHTFFLVSQPRALPSLGIGDHPNPEPHACPRHVRSDHQHVQPRRRAAGGLAGGTCRHEGQEGACRAVTLPCCVAILLQTAEGAWSARAGIRQPTSGLGELWVRISAPLTGSMTLGLCRPF